jgi:hypothetical protein
MRNVTFKTDLFTSRQARPRSEKALGYFLNTLYLIDCDFLRDNPTTPGILAAGVEYKREKLFVSGVGGKKIQLPESWKSVPEIIRDGFGDCEDLACWLAAMMTIQRGIPSRPVWTVKRRGGFSLYHIIVQDHRGKKYDPSRALGMR